VNRVGRYLRWHVVIWKLGGARERVLFALLCATAYVFLPATLVWMFVWGVMRLDVPFEFGVMVAIAATNILLLIDVLGVAVYTRESLRELLRLGHFTEQNVGLASEYLAYMESHGDGKRLWNAARMALLDFALFYGLIVLSIAFGLFVLPVVGSPTFVIFFAIDAPAVLAFHRFSRKKQPIIYGLADAAGVRLSKPMFSRFP
jgi:hypothetical protein